MKNLLALLILGASVNVHAVPFNKKVDPSKLMKELTAAGCKVAGITMEGTGKGDVSTNCAPATVSSVVAKHVYKDPAVTRTSPMAELGALEDKIDAGEPFTTEQDLRFKKLILLILGLSKNP